MTQPTGYQQAVDNLAYLFVHNNDGSMLFMDKTFDIVWLMMETYNTTIFQIMEDVDTAVMKRLQNILLGP